MSGGVFGVIKTKSWGSCLKSVSGNPSLPPIIPAVEFIFGPFSASIGTFSLFRSTPWL